MKQILADGPFASRGESTKRWEAVSKNLELVRAVPIRWSAISCKARCVVLVKAHKVINCFF